MAQSNINIRLSPLLSLPLFRCWTGRRWEFIMNIKGWCCNAQFQLQLEGRLVKSSTYHPCNYWTPTITSNLHSHAGYLLALKKFNNAFLTLIIGFNSRQSGPQCFLYKVEWMKIPSSILHPLPLQTWELLAARAACFRNQTDKVEEPKIFGLLTIEISR